MSHVFVFGEQSVKVMELSKFVCLSLPQVEVSLTFLCDL